MSEQLQSENTNAVDLESGNNGTVIVKSVDKQKAKMYDIIEGIE